MPTPQIDIIFELLITMDMDEEENLLILEQEIAMLDKDELNVCIKGAKSYKKSFGYFYDRLINERNLRKKH